MTGKVLPVGGIKEKTLAAKRSGAKIVVLPFANKRDFDELPDYVRSSIIVQFRIMSNKSLLGERRHLCTFRERV